MITRIIIENYGPFNETTTFDFTAKSKNERLAHKLEQTKISKLTAIFGKNGSGKTAMQEAILFVKTLIQLGTLPTIRNVNNKIIAQTNFNMYSDQGSTTIEIHLYIKKTLYKYYLKYSQKGIISEKLRYKVINKGNIKYLFNRKNNKVYKQNINNLNTALIIKPKNNNKSIYMDFLTFWSKINFVFNIKSSRQELLNWACKNMEKMLLQSNNYKDSDEVLEKYFEKHLYPLFKSADANINLFKIKKVETVNNNQLKHNYVIFHKELSNNVMKNKYSNMMLSDGTYNYIVLLILIVFNNYYGGTLFINEFGTNMHPEMSSLLLEVMENENTNKNAQYIFNSNQAALIKYIDNSQRIFIDNFKGQGSEVKKFNVQETRNRSIFKNYCNGTLFGAPLIDAMAVYDMYEDI